MHPLTPVFERCEQEHLRYCVLRDAARATDPDGDAEVDLLVNPGHLEQFERALVAAGFVRLAAWGRSPHRFFIHYDEAVDRWVKADVVTEVAFGRPVHSLRSTLAGACLERRRRVGPVWGPGPEDELVTLLLHELLDKGRIREHRAARLRELHGQVRDTARIDDLLGQCWPSMSWSALSAIISAGDWDSLVARRTEAAQALRSREPLATLFRDRRDRVFRMLFRAAGLVSPHAPSLALLAPDGAGKSTLAEGIAGRFFGPVCSVYMGLYQKQQGRAARRAPGLGLAGLVVTQWRRYLRGRYGQASGHLVLFDRYSYDALLPARGSSTVLRRIRRWLLAWSVPAPDLTVVLDAPGDMLFARKGEHTIDDLERQRQAYLALSRRLPRVAVVNAQQEPARVRRAVTALVWEQFRRKA